MKHATGIFLVFFTLTSISAEPLIDLDVHVDLPNTLQQAVSLDVIATDFNTWAEREHDHWFVELSNNSPVAMSVEVWIDVDARLRVHVIQHDYQPYPYVIGVRNYYILPGDGFSDRPGAELNTFMIHLRSMIVMRTIYEEFRQIEDRNVARAALSLPVIFAYDLQKEDIILRYIFGGNVRDGLSDYGRYYLLTASGAQEIEGEHDHSQFYPTAFRDPIFGNVNEISIRLAEFFEREVP